MKKTIIMISMLSAIGIAYVITQTIGFLFFPIEPNFIEFVFLIPILILWILYWMKLSDFEKTFMKNTVTTESLKN